MIDLARFTDKLRSCLEGYLQDPQVSAIPSGYTKVMGVVVSPAFETMNEAERQELVWDRVLRTFDESEVKRIEFIYTDAPSEVGPLPEDEPTVANPGT
jgi:hypothetical protein